MTTLVVASILPLEVKEKGGLKWPSRHWEARAGKCMWMGDGDWNVLGCCVF